MCIRDSARTEDDILREARRLSALKADCIEWRADWFSDALDAAALKMCIRDSIKITADSTCDLSEELLRQWNISLMPMHILMGDDTYLDGVTIHPADVFAHVDAGGQTPKSAAANPVEYIDFFEPFAKEYDAVIHISVLSLIHIYNVVG